MKKIILTVSGGMLETKKTNIKIRQKIRYLNYGLLGLSTLLKHTCSIETYMFQGEYDLPNETLRKILDCGINISKDCICILLSIPSLYSVSWCKEFCKLVKENFDIKIIVGGRWVVDNRVDWIKNTLIYIDDVITGFGEKKIIDMFSTVRTTDDIYDGSKKCFDWLDYSLLHGYEKYQPCIEISRGCGSGCQFCADKTNKRTPNKEVSLISEELDNINKLYNHNDYSIYFQAPHFVFETKWIDNLCRMLADKETSTSWRCTTRVETIKIDKLKDLKQSGLRVIDIGLESASPKQLLAMHKTKDPKKYLDLAEKILIECNNLGIWVKFNLLLYAGETYNTVNETINWITNHKKLIKNVSVSSLTYYNNMASLKEFFDLGASIPKQSNLFECGYCNLNLSSEIDATVAQSLTIDIPKLISTQRDFYDIKKISYFEIGYTYFDFLKDLEECNLEMLPFAIEGDV